MDLKRKVIICVDGSEHSDNALNWYHKHVYRKGDEVGLVHVHVTPSIPTVGIIGGGFAGMELYKENLKKSMQVSKDTVTKYENICKERGIPATVHLETMKHSVGQTICKVANEEGASQIVTGKRGLGVIRRTLLGSVSDYILHHTDAAMTIVPPKLT